MNDLCVDTMITKWEFGKFERTHHPLPLSVMYSVGLTTKKHIPTPFIVIFIAFHSILSDFDPNFVTIYQVWSLKYQFYPLLMMLWEVEQKKYFKKMTTMDTTAMRMENERIFQVFFQKFPI